MSALPYQPAPTLAQRKALHADHAKRYRDVQNAPLHRFPLTQYDGERAKVEFERPDPCQCCAVDDEETGIPLPALLGWCLAGLGTWAAVGYATWWLVGLFTGVK